MKVYLLVNQSNGRKIGGSWGWFGGLYIPKMITLTGSRNAFQYSWWESTGRMVIWWYTERGMQKHSKFFAYDYTSPYTANICYDEADMPYQRAAQLLNWLIAAEWQVREIHPALIGEARQGRITEGTLKELVMEGLKA